jgi:hypothetical protein
MMSGECDLYGSHLHQRPDEHGNEWNATSFGNDAVTIPASELTVHDYWFTVKCTAASSYSIVARLYSNITLADGVPHSDMTLKEAMQHYILTVKAYKGDLTITVSPSSGTVKLYVSNTTEPQHNKIETYNYTSTNAGSVQELTIPGNEIRDSAGSQWGQQHYYVGVYGVDSDAIYTIIAHTANQSTLLQEGVATQGNVSAHAFKYYRFDVPDSKNLIVFSATAVNEGDPDLYVSKPCVGGTSVESCDQRPNQTSAQWYSMRVGQDYIVIDTDDEYNKAGSYFVGVYGYQHTTYSITASLMRPNDSQSTRTQLTDGVSNTGM